MRVMNMKTKKNPFGKLTILQFITVVFMILLLCTYFHWFGFGLEAELGLEARLIAVFMAYIFFPQLFRWIQKLSYDEVKYLTMAILVFVWTYSLYVLIRMIGYRYGKDFGVYVYAVSFIPIVILVFYLNHTREWGRFYSSLTRSRFEEYMEKKVRERAKKMELELKELGLNVENGETSQEHY